MYYNFTRFFVIRSVFLFQIFGEFCPPLLEATKNLDRKNKSDYENLKIGLSPSRKTGSSKVS